MKISKQILISFFALLFLAGCFPEWKVIEKPEMAAKGANFRISAPVGWIQLDGLEKVSFITMEGPGIQKIRIAQIAREKAFETLFKDKKATLEKDVMITELAEYYLADFKVLNPNLQITHKGTFPATIDKKQGFKILMEYATSEGLMFDVVAYGLFYKDQLYTLYFQAPRLYYFERDLPVFESVVKSFTLI